MAEIQYFHQLNRTSEVHPYFFSNMHSRNSAFYGLPTTISNVQGAWARAVRRVGLFPYENNRNLHGLRHMYVARADEMGLDPLQIQDMVGHSSKESQRVYGNKISKVQSLVKKVLEE